MSSAKQESLYIAIAEMRNTCINMATGGNDFSYERYETQRDTLLTFPEIKHVIPDWLIANRYGSHYWRYIKSFSEKYTERRTFLKGQFDELENYVKKGKYTPLGELVAKSLEKFDSAQLINTWVKINERVQDDKDGAITACRTLVESSVKKILNQNNIHYKKSDDLNDLYNKLKKNLKLNAAQYNNDILKKIMGGIVSVVGGLAAYRNEYGDAHGQDKENFTLTVNHVYLAVNLAGTLSTFLINADFERKK